MRRSVLVGAMLVSLAALGFAGTATASASKRDAPVQARVWVTTVDRSQLLHENASVTFHKGTSSAPTIVVDPTQSYQRVDGFGAAITDSSASVLYGLDPATTGSDAAAAVRPSVGDRCELPAPAGWLVGLHRRRCALHL